MAVAASGHGGVLVGVDPAQSDALVATTNARLSSACMTVKSCQVGQPVNVTCWHQPASVEPHHSPYSALNAAQEPLTPGERINVNSDLADMVGYGGGCG
jgi:hypothetical protein